MWGCHVIEFWRCAINILLTTKGTWVRGHGHKDLEVKCPVYMQLLRCCRLLEIQSRLYKCYPYKRYNFIYVKKILLPYKNTIGKTSECYMLISVITCSTPFFVNCTFISVNFEKIKVIIYESKLLYRSIRLVELCNIICTFIFIFIKHYVLHFRKFEVLFL